jgi:hypothetical protein
MHSTVVVNKVSIRAAAAASFRKTDLVITVKCIPSKTLGHSMDVRLMTNCEMGIKRFLRVSKWSHHKLIIKKCTWSINKTYEETGNATNWPTCKREVPSSVLPGAGNLTNMGILWSPLSVKGILNSELDQWRGKYYCKLSYGFTDGLTLVYVQYLWILNKCWKIKPSHCKWFHV